VLCSALCRLQEGPRLASFVAWALPRAAGVKELTVRFTNHHQAMKFQVLVGLFGVSLRTLGLSPGCHGAVPLQQPTINLIGYCTGALRFLLSIHGPSTLSALAQ
jgi:hypothetical protein